MTAEEIKMLNPSHIIISPGPGYPKDAGVCEQVISELKGIIPILGVCLGHQAICETFGAEITLAKRLMHGKQSSIHIANGATIFHGLAPLIQAARYHSLIAHKDTLPDELLVIAEDDDGEIMAVQHRYYEIYGLQFHPESILTPQGEAILRNFLKIRIM
jgi:anthranilate synthase component 2